MGTFLFSACNLMWRFRSFSLLVGLNYEHHCLKYGKIWWGICNNLVELWGFWIYSSSAWQSYYGFKILVWQTCVIAICDCKFVVIVFDCHHNWSFNVKLQPVTWVYFVVRTESDAIEAKWGLGRLNRRWCSFTKLTILTLITLISLLLCCHGVLHFFRLQMPIFIINGSK